MEIRWITQPPVSLWAGLEFLHRQPAATPLNPDWLAWSQNWQAFLATHANAQLWSHFVPLAMEYDSPRLLIQALLPKITNSSPSENLQQTWLAQLAHLSNLHQHANPNLLHELQLRSGPIRELAEARLPGLLRAMMQLAAPELIPDGVKIAVVEPVLGGGTLVYPLYNSIVWQGLLHQLDEQISEVLRLGWAIAQLNLEVPLLSGDLPRDVILQLTPWAAGPLALAAGEFVELTRCEYDMWLRTATLWQLAPIGTRSLEETCQAVWQWWETYLASRPSWPVALGALAQLLSLR
jgi:hypothetical protein